MKVIKVPKYKILSEGQELCKQEDLNEKLLRFDDVSTLDTQRDNLFNIADLDKVKPKILQWLLNYNVKVDNISIDIYDGKPGIFVDGDINLAGKGITYLPYQFVEVKGSMNLSNNKLTSCKNLPIAIGGKLNINQNFIKSFEGLPTQQIGYSIEADHQKCKTLYPLTDENARTYIANGSDEILRKNRVKVVLKENYEYGTLVGLDESETIAKVVMDDTNDFMLISTEDVYPLEKDLI